MFLPCHWASCSPVLRAQWKVWVLATPGWFQSHSSDNICWASILCQAYSMKWEPSPGMAGCVDAVWPVPLVPWLPASPRLEGVAGLVYSWHWPLCLLSLILWHLYHLQEKAAVGLSVAMKHIGFSLNTDPALWSKRWWGLSPISFRVTPGTPRPTQSVGAKVAGLGSPTEHLQSMVTFLGKTSRGSCLFMCMAGIWGCLPMSDLVSSASTYSFS